MFLLQEKNVSLLLINLLGDNFRKAKYSLKCNLKLRFSTIIFTIVSITTIKNISEINWLEHKKVSWWSSVIASRGPQILSVIIINSLIHAQTGDRLKKNSLSNVKLNRNKQIKCNLCCFIQMIVCIFAFLVICAHSAPQISQRLIHLLQTNMDSYWE